MTETEMEATSDTQMIPCDIDLILSGRYPMIKVIIKEAAVDTLLVTDTDRWHPSFRQILEKHFALRRIDDTAEYSVSGFAISISTKFDDKEYLVIENIREKDEYSRRRTSIPLSCIHAIRKVDEAKKEAGRW